MCLTEMAPERERVYAGNTADIKTSVFPPSLTYWKAQGTQLNIL